MARRNSNTEQSDKTEAVEPEATEATGKAVEEESPKQEATFDLEPFQTAVTTAVEERDDSTGEVPATAIAEVNKVYRDLDGIKPKNAAKDWVEDQMKAAITELNVQLARAYSMVRDNLSAGKGTNKHREPADPKLAYVNRLASFQLAAGILENKTPEGVTYAEANEQATELATSLAEQVASYGDWLALEVPEGEEKPDAPEVSPIVRAAFKLSTGKASGGGRVSGGSGVRRDIGKHIAAAFADVEPGGFLSVAEIAKHKSEEYGDDTPSQGAVSARLFPSSGKCSVEGIEPVPAANGKPRGARKAA